MLNPSSAITHWGKILIATMLSSGLLAGCGDGSSGGSSSDQTSSPSAVANLPGPVAAAGLDRDGITTRSPQSPRHSEITYLDGSASLGANFNWAVAAAPNGATHGLTSANTPQSGFWGDTAGIYTLELTVSNGQGRQDTDTTQVTLIADMDNDGIADANDTDPDGDGFFGNDDAFPMDVVSHTDTDGDGNSNYFTADTDGDGTDDIADDLPLEPDQDAFPEFTEQKENSSFNQNDGIGVSEQQQDSDPIDVPAKINGRLESSNNSPDLDYYKTAWQAGRYSVVVRGAVAAMQPSVAVIREDGSAVPSTTANVPATAGVGAVSVQIPSDGTFYLVVADVTGRSDPSWSYTARIFLDQDMDGISDGLERAIDSNHLTADSDGDSVPDFEEIRLAIDDWAQYADTDGDGIPAWWDDDSDNDSIPDGVEYFTTVEYPNLMPAALERLNDADGDGVPNYLDTDSDANQYAMDRDEAGANPTEPTDTDGDGTFDFLDADNDGDGLLDINEDLITYLKPLVAPGGDGSNFANSMVFTSISNQNADGAENVCRSGDTIHFTGSNLPEQADQIWLVFRTPDGVRNVRPDHADDTGVEAICPDDIGNGLVEFFVANQPAGTRSDALGVLFVDPDTPVLSAARFDPNSGNVILTGDNLNGNISVQFEGATRTIYNNDTASATLSRPSGAQTGMVTVSSASGDSNSVYLTLLRQIPGTILPAGNNVDVTTLDMSYGIQNAVFPDAQNNFTATVELDGSTMVTALLETPNSTEQVPAYSLYMQGVALPNDSSVTVNANTRPWG